jgi:hypothetical protein
MNNNEYMTLESELNRLIKENGGYHALLACTMIGMTPLEKVTKLLSISSQEPDYMPDNDDPDWEMINIDNNEIEYQYKITKSPTYKAHHMVVNAKMYFDLMSQNPDIKIENERYYRNDSKLSFKYNLYIGNKIYQKTSTIGPTKSYFYSLYYYFFNKQKNNNYFGKHNIDEILNSHIDIDLISTKK